MVARAALRVLPLIVHARSADTATFCSAIALPCFRAAAVAWVAGRYPTHANQLRGPAAAAALPDAGHAYPGAVFRATDYFSVSARAAFSAACTAARFAAGANADVNNMTFDAAIASAAEAISTVVRAATSVRAARDAAEADAALIEAGGSRDKSIALAIELVQRPLWVGDIPLWAGEPWSELKALLDAAAEDWEVWTVWYADRLAGRPTDREIEFARTLLPDRVWELGPKAVNFEIKRRISEARNTSAALPDERSLPTLIPSAAIFVRNANGLIDLAPPGQNDQLTDTDDVRDFYLEPCRLAPRAFMTNSDGTMSTFTDDLPGADALWAAGVGVWAPAIAGIQSKPPMEIARVNRLIAQSPSNKPIHPPRAERRLRGTRRNPQDSLQCKGCIAVRLYPSDLRRSLDLVERIQ